MSIADRGYTTDQGLGILRCSRYPADEAESKLVLGHQLDLLSDTIRRLTTLSNTAKTPFSPSLACSVMIPL